MIHYLKSEIKNLLKFFPAQVINKLEFNYQSFSGFNERPIEFGFVFKQLVKIYPKTVLDVGTGTTALPHLIKNCGCLVTASDNIKAYWSSGMFNRHYHVISDDITDSRITGKFDLITCISVLEHIQKHAAAVKNMFNLLALNGYLIITFPYSEKLYVENVYARAGSNAFGKDIPFITQSFSRQELLEWCRQYGGKIVDQEFWRCWDGDCWTVGKPIIPPLKAKANEKHDLSCILIQKG